MEQIYSNSRIGHEYQLVYLNTERLIGVQSIDSTNNFGTSPFTYVGIGNVGTKGMVRSEQSASINISTFLINKDYFWTSTTGSSLSNLYIFRDNKDFSTCYSALSGYFTNFSCKYSVGNVPEISTTMNAIRNAGTIALSELSTDASAQFTTISLSSPDITGNLAIPFGNSISLGISDFLTNRVQSFTINATSNKNPVYNVGSKFPARIEHESTQITLDVSFVVADYIAQRLRSTGIYGVNRTLNLIAGDYSNTGNIVATYSIPDLTLSNESYSNQVNGDVIINQSYFKKIFPS